MRKLAEGLLSVSKRSSRNQNPAHPTYPVVFVVVLGLLDHVPPGGVSRHPLPTRGWRSPHLMTDAARWSSSCL